LKVKSKATIKREISPFQVKEVCLNGTGSRIIAFKIVKNFRMQAVNATLFTFPSSITADTASESTSYTSLPIKSNTPQYAHPNKIESF